MNIDVLTLFPEMIEPVAAASMLGRASKNGILDIRAVNIRDFTQNKHKKTDDTPFGLSLIHISCDFLPASGYGTGSQTAARSGFIDPQINTPAQISFLSEIRLCRASDAPARNHTS